MKALRFSAALSATLLILTTGSAAIAAEIQIKCEVRANRSKISVDATNLVPGRYGARVISGSNVKSTLPRMSVGDEIEFDFDSNRADIAAGAIAIPSSFIQNGTVTAKIRNALGRTVISDTELCRMR